VAQLAEPADVHRLEGLDLTHLILRIKERPLGLDLAQSVGEAERGVHLCAVSLQQVERLVGECDTASPRRPALSRVLNQDMYLPPA
jgi:hypothetical protein